MLPSSCAGKASQITHEHVAKPLLVFCNLKPLNRSVILKLTTSAMSGATTAVERSWLEDSVDGFGEGHVVHVRSMLGQGKRARLKVHSWA